MKRVLATSAAAACAVTAWFGAGAAAQAQPPVCGPDQGSAVIDALRHDQYDQKTQVPWNPAALDSNYDPCADLSAVVVSIDLPKPNSPRQVLMFNRGTYIGLATRKSRPYTTLNKEASNKNTVVINFSTGKTCMACNDGKIVPVGYRWDGFYAQPLSTAPVPESNWQK